MQQKLKLLSQHILREKYRVDLAWDDPVLDNVAGILRSKILAMPKLYGSALGLLIALFSARTAQQASATISKWQQSPVGPLREFVSFFEKLCGFIYYSIKN